MKFLASTAVTMEDTRRHSGRRFRVRRSWKEEYVPTFTIHRGGGTDTGRTGSSDRAAIHLSRPADAFEKKYHCLRNQEEVETEEEADPIVTKEDIENAGVSASRKGREESREKESREKDLKKNA